MARKRQPKPALESTKKNQQPTVLPLELLILEKLPMCAFVVQDNVILYANPSALKSSGYSSTELVGQPYTSFILRESLQLLAKHITNKAKGDVTSDSLHVKARHKSGKIIWLDLAMVLIEINEKPANLISWVDITPLQEKIAEMNERERSLQAITDALPFFIVKLDPELRFQFVNQAYFRNFNTSRERIIGKKVSEFLNKEREDHIKPFIDTCLQGKPTKYESSRTDSNGNLRSYYTQLIPELDETKRVIGIYIITSETSEVSEITASLHRSEQKLRKITDAIPVLINYIDKNLVYQFANNTYETMLGIRPNAILQKSVREVLGEEEFAKVEHTIYKILSGESTRFIGTFQAPNGRFMYYTSHSVPDINESGEVLGFFQVITDITETVKYQQELEKLNQISEQTRKLAQIGFFEINLINNQRYWSPELYDIYEHDQQEPPLSLDTVYERVHPDDRENIVYDIDYIEKLGKPLDYEYRYIVNTKTKYLRALLEPARDLTGKIVKLIGVVQDITNLRSTEASLRASESRLLKAQAIAKIGNFEVDLVNNTYYWSQSLFNLFEIEPSPTPPSFQYLLERIHPDDREGFSNIHNHNMLISRQHSIEFRLITMQGEIKYLQAMVDPVTNENGKLIKVSGIVQDTSHLRLIESKLLDSEERNREIFLNAPLGIFQSTVEGKFQHTNNQFNVMFGYASVADFQLAAENLEFGSSLFKSPDQLPKLFEYILHSEGWVQQEVEFKRKDDSVFIGLLTARTVRRTGRARLIEGFVEDITIRKEVESRIKASEDKYRNIFLAAKDAIVLIYGEEGRIADVNQAVCDIYGYTRKELLKMSILDLSANPSLTAFANKSRETEVPMRFHKRKDGSMFTVEVSASYFKMPDYNIDHAILIIKDISERKKTEDALKTSEELHRKLVDSLPDGVVMLDLNFNISYVTPRMLAMFGYQSEDEVLGLNALSWLVSDEHELAISNLVKILHNEERDLKLFHLTRKDGSILVADINGTMINDAKGKPAQIILVVHDLADRLKAEKDLFESNEKFRVVFEISPVGIVIIDPDTGTVSQCNNEVIQILGYSAQELQKMTLYDLNHPDDIQPEQEYIDKIFRGEISSYSLEKRYVNKSGDIVWVHFAASIVFKADNSIAYAIGVMRDISDVKLLESELKARESKYRNMVETLNEVIWETDTEHRFQYLSPRVREIIGYEPEQLVGKSYLQFIPDRETSPNINELLALVEKREEYRYIETPVITSDGNKIWLESNGYPMYDSYGRFIGYRGVSRDVTARKLAQYDKVEREKMLKATADIQNLLLQPWQEHVSTDNILEILGKTTQASRCYIFIQYTDTEGKPYILYENEWCAEGIEPQINNPELDKIYIEADSILAQLNDPDWLINSLIKDLPDIDREYLSMQGILSFLLVPLKLNEQTVGFIGLDNCVSEQIFTETEVTLLRTAAGALSQAYLRFKTYNELEFKESQLRVLLENIPVILWSTDMLGNYTLVEGKLLKQQGINTDEYINKNILDKTEELGHPKVKAVAINQALNGIPSEYYMDYYDKFYHIITSPIFDSSNTQTGIIGVSIDITEQHKTQENLRQSESKYRMLVETINDGLMLADENQKIVYANQRFADLMGKELEDIIGINRHQLLADQPDSIKATQEEMYRRRRLGLTDQYEVPFELTDGRLRWVRVSATPVILNGVYKGSLSLFHDFTEIKESELKHKELIASLELAMHEIKTLSGLIPICSYCKKIRDDSGYWSQLEAYFAKHTEASFSHSICPDCYGKLMSEFEEHPKESEAEDNKD